MQSRRPNSRVPEGLPDNSPTWCLGLVADGAALLRNLALMEGPTVQPLQFFQPKQGILDLDL